MKTTNKILGFATMAGVMLAMGACSTEPNFQPSMAGIPQASDYQIGISVDEFNNIELNILDKEGNRAKGVYPVWYVNESTRPSTALTYRDLITIAGEYPVEMKVGNGNGVSEGSVTGTIRVDKTIFDFTPYINGLTNGSFKEWAVDGTKQGHMGCGPDTNDPTGWWNGNPGDKEAEGVYANTLTFAYTGADTSGTYVFDPGTSGTIYVNTGVHSLPGYTVNNPDDGNDFRVEAKTVESTFTLSAEGPNLYLVLPANTPFPYIPSEAGFANPKYRISKFSKNEITLVQDLDGISWQYIIAPKAEADVTTSGFKYDYEHNLWKDASVVIASTWFANNDWAELGEQPTVELTPTKGIKLHTPADTGNSQWQGQVHVETDIEVHSGITYDFSCNVNVPKAGAVTVKVQKLDDDGVFFVESPYEVEPNGSIVWFADMEGFDGTLKIAFDFGGFGDCDIEVSNIVFKEHQYDDGTKIPNAAVENPPVISDEDNLFANFEVLKWSTWFADSSWSDAAITQPEIVFMPGGYSFIAPEGIGGDQWQGQVHVWTNVGISAEHKYDFMLTIESDKDISGVTVKIQKGDSFDADKDADDAVAFSVDRVNVEAGEPYTYFFKGKPGFDSTNLQVCMDYAGAPGKANISVSDIRMQIAK